MILPLVALLLGAFCIGTTELVVAGILPAIAADLEVSIPRAGMLVSGYAVSVAFGGPALMVLASRYPRKPALVAVILLFMLAHVGCALAPGFAALVGARMVAAAAHGTFFGLAIVLATSSVPPERQATALSIVVGGIGVANVVGVPLGAAVGNAWGWRASFALIAAFSAVAALAVALLVPDARETRTATPLGHQIRALANRTVLSAYALVILMMIATFSFVTFVAPYLAETAGVGPDLLPLVLFGFGFVGAAGTFAGGRLTDAFPTASLVASYLVAAAGYGLVWLAMPRSSSVGMAAIVVIAAGGSIAALSAQHRILVGAFRAPELASTLMSSVFNVGIAAGATIGAVTLARGMPVSALPLIGFTAMALASVVAVAAVVSDRP
jgi:MFS transporter, DHA1 family, inner membrane transport protein